MRKVSSTPSYNHIQNQHNTGSTMSSSPATHSREKRRGEHSRPPPLLVTLASRDIMIRVLEAKHGITSFSTADLDLSPLDGEAAGHVIASKIFINENLPSVIYKDFLGLKTIAKSLGFKFVWHKAGRFLVRRVEREREHIVSNHLRTFKQL